MLCAVICLRGWGTAISDSLLRRKLESDAENRCSREVVSVRNLLILKFIPLQSEMTTLFSCLTSKAPDCELAIWGLDNNQR